jgi:hypothetical protein
MYINLTTIVLSCGTPFAIYINLTTFVLSL